MTKRRLRATKPARYFADLIGVTPKTIKRYAEQYGWQKITYGNGRTATIFLYEKQVLDWIAERQNAGRSY